MNNARLTIILAIVGILVTILTVLALASKVHACGWFENCDIATNQQQNEQQKVTNTITKLEVAVPIPQLNDSLERKNISKRLTTFNDPNKVSYIYLVSYGRVMSFYVVKGKVTSGGKRLTSTERKIGINCGQYCNEVLAESPELDGTYGSSAPYIYFWTTDNVYVQWSGDYMMVDQPLKLATQPELVREIK